MDSSPHPAPPSDDALLLRCYVREGSEAAFRALAERCLPLVWSVARRVVNGDAAMAEDVAQVVLADFARKAHTLPPGTVPAAWLHRHTVFTASKAVRTEVRRRAREQAAAHGPPIAADPMNPNADPWTELAPHIDTALDRLPAADRTAIVLRFYEQRPLREVGRAIGTTEEAVRKRIDRALEKLRSHLQRRGVVPAAALLASMLREKSTAAPAAGALQRMVSGAWRHVETGTSPALVSTSPPWWRRRSVLAGAAALTLISALVLWMVNRDHPPAPVHLLVRPGPLPATNHVKPAVPAAAAGTVTLTATLITLPEKSVAGRLLRYTPGTDDAALFRELLPQAESLQKQVPADAKLATTGYPLVILSGPAKVKTLSKPAEARKPPRPGPGDDPFAGPGGLEDPLTGDEGQDEESGPFDSFSGPARFSSAVPSLKVAQEANFPYATEWPYNAETGRVKPSDFASRTMGTFLAADVYPLSGGAVYPVACFLQHMLSPELEDWPYYWPDDESENRSDEETSTAITQPVFHSVQFSEAVDVPASGEPVMAAMTTTVGDADRDPQRVLLFLNLQP